jgi:hypothetical protein
MRRAVFNETIFSWPSFLKTGELGSTVSKSFFTEVSKGGNIVSKFFFPKVKVSKGGNNLPDITLSGRLHQPN